MLTGGDAGVVVQGGHQAPVYPAAQLAWLREGLEWMTEMGLICPRRLVLEHYSQAGIAKYKVNKIELLRG